MKKNIIKWALGAALFFSAPLYGQQAQPAYDYKATFEWMKTTFEQNDAGFSYIVDKKGMQAYDLHNQAIYRELGNVKTPNDFTRVAGRWQDFFRSGHIGIRYTGTDAAAQQKGETCYDMAGVDLVAFRKYAEGLKEPTYEGIWALNAYKIGIKKNRDGSYTGFIVESESENWKPGQLKFTLSPKGPGSVFYMGDHTPVEFNYIDMMGPNKLVINGWTLNRLSPALPEDPAASERYARLRTAAVPFVERMNSNTLLLRIPDFGREAKPAIDSVIVANLADILSTGNLIIDITYNGGGSDASFQKLRPILYTNPVRSMGVEFLSTELNNKMMHTLATDPQYGMTEFASRYYEKLRQHPGEFVPMDDEPVETHRLDTVYAMPRQVGIIINGGNASTAEEFLLMARQSRKVKLFGMPTWGMLDMSNVNSVTSPDGQYELYYCLSRSYRIPDMAIDEVGIQPDFFIDRGVPQYKWVDFVNDVLNSK